MSGRTYTRDEVQAILSRALETTHGQGDDLSHDELLAVARELGIDSKAVDAAADNVREELAFRRAFDERVRARRRGFVNHLIPYLIVNAFLFAINFLTGGAWWFLWPVLGWGIGLTFHARAAFFPDRVALEKNVRKKLERDREREERKLRRDRAKRTGQKLEGAVEDVVAGVVGVIADAIQDSRAPKDPRARVARPRPPQKPGVRVVTDAEWEAAEDEASEEERARSRGKAR